MTAFLDLDRLLVVGRPSGHIVAWRGGQAVHFADFLMRVDVWCAAFANVAGDRVALYFEDSIEFAAALLGAWHSGKQAVLPADLLPDTLRRLAPLVSASAGDFPKNSSLQSCVPGLAPGPGCGRDALEPDRVVLHVFTSGSTGDPILISKRLGQLCAEVRALEAAFGARIGRGCVHATVTHQHMYGLPFRVLWPLAAGRSFAARRMVFPEDMLAALADSPEAVLIASPAHLKRLPEHLDWSRAARNVATVFSAGGPLPGDAVPLCRQLLGHTPTEIYGSSELGAVAWRQRDSNPDAAWQPLPGMRVRVEGERLLLRAPWLDRDEFQESSDRVVERVGGFALLGRNDRIVKIEEKRVSLQAIERQLHATGLVHEVRALVLAGDRARVGVVAVPNAAGWMLYDTADRRAFAERLRASLTESIEAAALPRHWRFPWALPTNAAGKSTQAALLALFDPCRPHARLLEHTADAARLRIDVTAALPQFDGHFVGFPILPGVAQVDWAIRFARELFPLSAAFSRLDNIKFHDWIGADICIELTLQRVADHVVAFRIGSARGAHASGRLVFDVAP